MGFKEKLVRPLAESLGARLPKKPSRKQKHPWMDKNGEPKKPSPRGWSPAFDALCEAHGLPLPEYEYLFDLWKGGDPNCLVHPLRKDDKCPLCGAARRLWRFDYLFDGIVAVEKQGGVWTKGRHSRGKGQLNDMEKFNRAQTLGYVVLLFPPWQLGEGTGKEPDFCAAFPIIKEALKSTEL